MEAVEFPEIFAPIFEEKRFKVLYGGRGGGKCLGLGTPVLMYDGTIKPVERVVVGDRVMGPDSKPRIVLSITRGESELFKVKQTSGEDYIVNDEHILSLKKSLSCGNDTGGVMKSGNLRRPRGRYPGWDSIVNIPVRDYLKQSKRWKEHFRGYRAGRIHFAEQSVPVDPYLLGVWLGDGLHRELMVTSADYEIANWLEEFCEGNNLRFTVGGKTGNAARDYRLAKKSGMYNHIWDGFKELNVVSNKHIPQCYISNSEDVRLRLLAGLIDTDGHYRNHGYSITQANHTMAIGIKRLADSLGFRTHISKKQTKCGEFRGVAWQVSINGDVWDIPCQIERKKYKHNGIFPNKDKTLSYLTVESIGIGQYAGFSVDGDHLFCLGDGTVTHNSWAVARYLLILAASKPTRILCCREYQRNMKDSVHQLLVDQINAMGLTDHFDITKNEIKGYNGSQFNFEGIALNPKGIKSYEGVDHCWVEEADSVSNESWKILIPTIRRQGSEIWVTFNPEFEDDYAYKRWVVENDDRANVIFVNFRDNNYFPDTLEEERRDCELRDPDNYEHIWEGKPIKWIDGAIYAKQLKYAYTTNRIRKLGHIEKLPVYIAYDTGRTDDAVMWFFQIVDDRIHFIDCYGSPGGDVAEMASQALGVRVTVNFIDGQIVVSGMRDGVSGFKLDEADPVEGAEHRRRYNYAEHIIPHDARQSRYDNQGKTVELQMKAVSRKYTKFGRIRVLDKHGKQDRIQATRMSFEQIWIDQERCGTGIRALKKYRRELQTDKKSFKATPKHDWSSHYADSFGYAIMGWRFKTEPKPDSPEVHRDDYDYYGDEEGEIEMISWKVA